MKKAHLAIVVILLLISAFIPIYQQSNQAALAKSFFSTSYASGNFENFTIVVLPDTQGYCENYPWIFDNQTQWIADNVDALNIVFVAQLGDLVNIPYNTTQWEVANQSMSKLDGKVPWAVLLGNHDEYNGNLTNYNIYFGPDRFSGKTWYGGSYKAGDNANSYQLFSAGGEDYLVFSLQCEPSNDALCWASNIINAHPDRKVIVSTHDYLRGIYGIGQRSEIGERIYYSLVKPHADQIFLVLCGHSGAEDLIADSINGNVIYQILADYQNSTYIESGWLRILEFSPIQGKVFVKTYSPILNEYKHDPQSEFTLDYNKAITPSDVPKSPARYNTTYIRADGSIEPPTNLIRRDEDTYILLGNIFGSLVVERDDVVIDGAGFTIRGHGADYLGEREYSGSIKIGNVTKPFYNYKDVNTSYVGIYSCAERLTIMNLKITEFWCGIELEHASDNRIVGNDFINNNQGIWIYYSSNNTISNNTISNNCQGLTLVTSHDIIQNNNILNNSWYGIKLSWAFSNFSGNNITNNGNGVCVTLSSHNIFSGNIFLNNTRQVNLKPSADVYFDNETGADLYQGLANSWDDGEHGNYWSNYNGTDSNNDGIGDTPYTIDANNKDNYPLIAQISASSNPASPSVELLMWIVLPLAIVIAVRATMVIRRKKLKQH